MAQPPTTPVLSRELVRVLPASSQRTFVTNLGNGASLVAEYDVAIRVTDPNQLLVGAAPSAGTIVPAIGPWLDAVVFSLGVGTLLVEYAVDNTASYRTLSSSAVPASTLLNIAGLRITARFCRITFTNTSGAAAVTEFGAYVRNN
jgi:hypothetical protein